MPGVSEIKEVAPFVREWGVIVVVLFILLFSGLAAWIFVWKFGQALARIEVLLKSHSESTAPSLGSMLAEQKTIQENLQSFRDSEKDCIGNVKNLCEKIFERSGEMSVDLETVAEHTQSMAEFQRAGNEKIKEIFTYFLRRNGDNDSSAKR
jgi:hypothetical protein